VTTHIRLFQDFYNYHHLASLPNLIHLHFIYCRNLTLHWTRGRFHPSSNYLQYRPHVHFLTSPNTSKHARTSFHDNPRRLAIIPLPPNAFETRSTVMPNDIKDVANSVSIVVMRLLVSLFGFRLLSRYFVRMPPWPSIRQRFRPSLPEDW